MASTFRFQLLSTVTWAFVLVWAGCSPPQHESARASKTVDEPPTASEPSQAGSSDKAEESYILSQPTASFSASSRIESFAAPAKVEPMQTEAMMVAPPNRLRAAPTSSLEPDLPGAHLTHLPAGTQRNSQAGFSTVRVFYATDRKRDQLSLSDFHRYAQNQNFVTLSAISATLIFMALVSLLLKRVRIGALCTLAGGSIGCLAIAMVFFGKPEIEKQGVVYTGDRGELVRGICDVTVPDSHRTGLVERPSLLRFEFREDQSEHVVLTSAVELSNSEFSQKLSQTLDQSRERDLLVFIHGFNVGFEAAVQRTAQIAVDLPFEGVPICYSWPSQGSLLGYSIDENNSEWTIPHLKQFLLELANSSGAKSINVVAHSMGNRVMTAAMQQINMGLAADAPAPFDRIVLAAPDVDADRFRRDFAPALLNVSNQVTLYASSDDRALIASKQVHGYPRAGESGANIVIVPGIETIDVSGIDLSLLGHSYYGDSEPMLRDLFGVVRARLLAPQRQSLVSRRSGELVYWQLAQRPDTAANQVAPNQLR